MVTIFEHTNSLMSRFVAELRDVQVQGDSMRFRRNLERIGEIMAYEISKTLHYNVKRVETPLGESEERVPDDEVVIASILRAGVPFHQGFLNYFDDAQNIFIAAYRKYSKDNSFNIKVEYISACDLSGKVLLLVDPMVATGSSMEVTYKALVEKAGMPKHTHIATVIASEEGIEHMRKVFSPKAASIWCASVDAEMTVKSYIVPGLGDVGDLAYGEKL